MRRCAVGMLRQDNRPCRSFFKRTEHRHPIRVSPPGSQLARWRLAGTPTPRNVSCGAGHSRSNYGDLLAQRNRVHWSNYGLGPGAPEWPRPSCGPDYSQCHKRIASLVIPGPCATSASASAPSPLAMKQLDVVDGAPQDRPVKAFHNGTLSCARRDSTTRAGLAATGLFHVRL